MNQIIKEVVYKKGTQRQVDFLAEIGGMNMEEREFFQRAHEGQIDEVIGQEMGLDKKAFSRVENAVSVKLNVAIFECIYGHMEWYRNTYQ